MNKQLLVFGLLLSVLFATSCKPKFTKLKSGLEIMKVKRGEGKREAKEGDIFLVHLQTKINDSVIFNSFKENDGKPVPGMISKPQFKGDPMEGIMQMHEGDSVVLRTTVDTSNRDKLPPFAKIGDKMVLCIKMVKLQTEAEYKADKEKEAASMNVNDDKKIQDYLTQNNLTAQKTKGGVYYIITQPGSGTNAGNGQQVSMKYTGKLLDGTVFDSNEDPKFGHTEPLDFVIGTGQVIRGWDEGISQLNKGCKARLFVPSSLAYGGRKMPGNANNPKGIPAHSILTFDVTLLSIKDAPASQMPEMNPSASKPH